MFMSTFLSRVAQYNETNRMTAYNLSVVFGPCFLRPEKYTQEDLLEYALCISILSAVTVVKILQIVIENVGQVIHQHKYQDLPG